MLHFQIKQSINLPLTSHAGLALIGECFEAAQVESVIDPKLPVSPSWDAILGQPT